MKSIYLCPVCKLELMRHQASQGLHCDNKHHFDKNEHGYWVFSLPKKPKIDSRQQMRSKRFLLESGVFEPLLDKMAEMLRLPLAAADKEIQHLDYDCGEGYYLRALKEKLANQQASTTFASIAQHGISEAENAIFSAAKIEAGHEVADPATLIVSQLKTLPFGTENFDLVTLIDKQLKGKELLRVLKQQGLLLQVSPGPRHLWQIREFIYPDLKEKPLTSAKIKELELLQTERVSFDLSVTGEQALTLLEMTPYAWRANDKIRKSITMGSFESLEIDFIVTLSKKK